MKNTEVLPKYNIPFIEINKQKLSLPSNLEGFFFQEDFYPKALVRYILQNFEVQEKSAVFSNIKK